MGVVLAMAVPIAHIAPGVREVPRSRVSSHGLGTARTEGAHVPRRRRRWCWRWRWRRWSRPGHRIQTAQRTAWRFTFLADAPARRQPRQLSPRAGDDDAAADWGGAAEIHGSDCVLPGADLTRSHDAKSFLSRAPFTGSCLGCANAEG